MGKYGKYHRRRQVSRPREIHPVWRGIGCIIILLIPPMSYVTATILVNYGLRNNWPIPYQLTGTPILPNFIWNEPILTKLFTPMLSWTNIYANLLITLVLIVFFAGLISLGYAILYQFIGPPRYSSVDTPPPRVKVKPYRR